MKINLRLVLASVVIISSFLAGNWYSQRSAAPTDLIASDLTAPAKDPVCSMEVDKAKAKAAGRTSEYQGKTYYFCSDYCKKEFDKNPAGYLKEKPANRHETSTQIDPICGMEVDSATAKGKSKYQGKMYYFCSESCKKTFDTNPKKYL